MSPSLRSPLGALSPEILEKPPVTAASIANAYFKAELDHHHHGNGSSAETVVILHDSCYGHRYSRPRTSKMNLSSVVERPERIKASVLGVSLAYVRLGERHAEGMYALHPKLEPASVPSIPFRIHKTARRLSLTAPAVTHVHGTKWMEELKMMCQSAESKLAINGKELQRPDINRGPDQGEPHPFHEGDLYLCAESLSAFEGALGGVCEAVDAVFKPSGPKRAFVAIRPPGHHCSASWPAGFCWINNVHVGITYAHLSHGLTHAAIIDFDLHHGDGSQSIALEHNAVAFKAPKNVATWKKTAIGYFSLHEINSFPCEDGKLDKITNASMCIENSHGQDIWNVHLEPWKTEAEFWALYESKYMVLLDKARQFLKAQTDRLRSAHQISKSAIFLSAGFDASEWEGAGMQRHNVNVPTDFYARLTRDVTRMAAEEGTSVEGRIVSVLEGGYSDRALYSGILSHLSGLAGDDPVPTKDEAYNGLGYEMGQRIGSVRSRKDSLSVKKPSIRPYEPSWWKVSELERMEATMVPLPEPNQAPRNNNNATPTYSTPTQASKAKVVTTPKVRRSMSGLSSLSNGSPLSRPPSPPPPDVPWTVAAHELSKLLIPSDRQTESCTAEELSAEATRARRDRQFLLSQSGPPGVTPSAPAAAPNGPTRVSMRERKQVKPFGSIDEEEEERKNRRRTVAGSSVLASEKVRSYEFDVVQQHAGSLTEVQPQSRGAANPPGRPKQLGRRLSAASTAVSEAPELEVPLPCSINVSTRSTSPQSVRPESSMSMATTAAPPLAVKKTRNVSISKKEPSKVLRAPKKAPAAEPTKPVPLAASTSVQAPVKFSDKTSDDMDGLTAGMKKIRINVVSAVQKEAREKAKREKAEQKAHPVKQENISPKGYPAKQENIPPIPQPEIKQAIPSPTAVTPTDTGSFGKALLAAAAPQALSIEPALPQQHTLAGPPSGPATPSHDQLRILSPLDAQHIPLPVSSPVLPSTPQHQALQSGSGEGPVFVPYQPEGVTPEALPQTQPLQWLPPNNAATPSPMKRSELPVFTSTSAIPFAARQAEAGGLSPTSSSPFRPEPKSSSNSSVWDVPESPRK